MLLAPVRLVWRGADWCVARLTAAGFGLCCPAEKQKEPDAGVFRFLALSGLYWCASALL